MPKYLPANLRSAYIAEDFGALVLRGLGAVAEVQRQEDFGIDAFWTLLNRLSNTRFEALDTSFVQLKAGSVRKLQPEDVGEPDWIAGLKLPLYYGLVTIPGKGEPQLELYSSHLLYDEHAMRKGMPAVGVCFDSKDATYPTFRWHQDMNNAGPDGKNPEDWYSPDHLANLDPADQLDKLWPARGEGFIWLGPPVVTLTLQSFEDPAERLRCLEIVDFWNRLELQNRAFSHMRHVNRARWKPNEMPHSTWPISQPANRDDYLPILSPATIAMLMERALQEKSDDEFERAVSVYEFIVGLGGASIDLDNLREARENYKALQP